MKHRIFVMGIFIFLTVGWTFGQTWDHMKRLTYTSGITRAVKVATDSVNTVHVVWSDDTSGNFEIYYKNCDNGGTGTWSALKRLTWNSGQSDFPDIAIGPNDYIHVVWIDNTPGNDEIYHKFSTDGGTTWSSIIRTTWTSGGSQDVNIAASSNNWIRMAYLEYKGLDTEIHYKEYNPGTKTWSAPVRLTYTSGYATNPWIGVDGLGTIGGNIHIVWEDNSVGNKELYHKISTDNGDTWSAVQRLTYTSGDSQKPCFVFTSNNWLRLVYYDNTTGDHEIYYKERNPGSGAWEGLRRLTWTPDASLGPTVAFDADDDIHVIYSTKTSGIYDLYHKKSTDGGNAWSAVTRITWWNFANWPRIVVSGVDDHIHLVYIAGTNPESYFKRGNQTIIY